MRLPVMWFLLLICTAGVLNAQETGISARLDSTKTIVGATVNLEVKVSLPADAEAFWPVLNDSVGNLDLINTGEVDSQRTSDGLSYLLTRNYTLMAFDSGLYEIPPLRVNVRRNNKDQQALVTDVLKLQVYLVPVDTTAEIKDIAPLVEVPYDWKTLLIWTLAGLLLIAAGIWIYRKYFRGRQKEIVTVSAPVKPPHETALEELAALRNAGLWQLGKVKDYYTELTDILRRYISERFRVNAMELTSDEVLSAGFIRLLENDTKEHLTVILRTADLVKFAKSKPLPQDHEQCMTFAEAFVRSTIPAPAAAVKEEVRS